MLFCGYGALSALMLICFLLINYLVKEKTVKAGEDAEKGEGGGVDVDSGLGAGKKQTLTAGATFDESAFMSPAGTPFIPASRTPAGVAAARGNTSNVFNENNRGKSNKSSELNRDN